MSKYRHIKIKKPEVHFIIKNIFPIGCLTFIFNQKCFMIKWTEGFFILMWRYVGVLQDEHLLFKDYLQHFKTEIT